MEKSLLYVALGFSFLLAIVFFMVSFSISENDLEIANPASSYCIEMGYKLEIRSDASGEYGVCVYGDEECEEWAFFRGECSFSSIPKCVPKTCCHPTECVLYGEQDDCSDSFCTMNCEPGTLDCGYASCQYIDGQCEVV